MADAENRRAALRSACTVHSTACGYASAHGILALAEVFLAWLEQEEPADTD
jgi:hypothetical protein